MEREIFSFEGLAAYKEARRLVVRVYKVSSQFPPHERFALCSQLQRSVISVPSNIAEGSGRSSYKEKIHFIEIAYGSLMETYCQLQIAVDLNYITADTYNECLPDIEKIGHMLTSLRRSFYNKINESQK